MMSRPGSLSFVCAAVVFGLLVAGVTIKLVLPEAAGLAKTLTLSSFGLLLALLGNLVPKVAPVGAGVPDAAQRDAGRLLLIAGAALILFALIGPADLALLGGSAIGLLGLGLAAVALIFSKTEKRNSAMPKNPSPIRAMFLLLLVGLAGAFALILIDRMFGDQAAQWSAVVWVLILGVVTSATTIGLTRKGR